MKSESNHNAKEVEVDGLPSLRQGTPPILVESDISTGTDSLRSISDDLVMCKIQPTNYDRMDEVQSIRKERQNSCRGLVWKRWVRNVFHQNSRQSSPSCTK